jgi:hypothetical protein
MKPTDKAIFGMVSKSPGRNASEPTGGLEKKEIWRPSPLVRGEGSMDRRRLAEAASHSGGVVGAARGQGHVKQLEKPSSSRREIGGAGSRITRNPGKSVEDERVAEGFVVAMNWGNSQGAKEPCCTVTPWPPREAGAP